MEIYSSKRIIEKLQSTDKKENAEAVQYLFRRTQDQVAHFILKNKGTATDVDDTFQDGFIALIKLVREHRIEKVQDIEAYLYSICRNLWLKRLQRSKREVELTETQEAIPVPEVSVAKLLGAEKKEALDTLLKGLGEGCHRIMIFYYYERLSMKQIAEKMSFASADVAKNKKSSCLKKLKKLILDSPHYRKLLNDREEG